MKKENLLEIYSFLEKIEKRDAELKLLTEKLNDGSREKSSWIEKMEALDTKLLTAEARILE